MGEVTFRHAVELDTPAITSIIQSGFTRDFLSTTIYGCPGVSAYIRAHILAPDRSSDTEYFVAAIADDIVGCLEFRRVPRGLWLNYVAVVPNSRVSGLGSRLLDFALRTYPSIVDLGLYLDVLNDNTAALHWYDRLGFKMVGEKQLFRLRLPESNAVNEGVVAGFAQAQVTHQQFGFSEFTVRTSDAEHTIGRIGNDYFRFRETAALEDAGLLSVLRAIDRDRQQVLCAGSREASRALPATAEHYATLVRMSVPISEVSQSLKLRLR